MTLFVVAVCASVAAQTDIAGDSYLLRVDRALQLCRKDIAAMAPIADEAARKLADGGALYAGGQPSMVSELCGRAGGFMLIKPLKGNEPTEKDVVIFAQTGDHVVADAVAASGATVIALGGAAGRAGVHGLPNHAEATGISPTLANAIPGWVFTGELVAALTRLGKMPVMYASIGIYSGYPRIYQYQKEGIFWHDKHGVKPVGVGVLGNRFIDVISAMLHRVAAEEYDRLARAGAWAAEATQAGRAVRMYSMGHLFPDEVANTSIGEVFASGVWNSGFFQHTPPNDPFAAGDVLVHIGYQHPPYRMLERARPAGAKVVYVDVLQHRDYVKDDGVLWIDPMWPWVDACVAIEGYDVPVLASSGIVNGAIAWDIHRLTRAAQGR
ncbi:MAG: hypothetical protein GY851_22195 [bacterium]|nr:hypothetical protein [bacterium]